MNKLLVVVAVAACSASPAVPPGGGPPDSNTTTTGDIKIVSFTTTAATITGGTPLTTETDTVTLVAIVTDTKGLDTIAGGQVVDEAGATLAAFEAGTDKGTYTATLTFAQINQIKALDFPVGGGTLELTAKFFDNDANLATASAVVQLACRGTLGLEGACGGTCTNTAFDYLNCGTCGQVCAPGLECAGTCSPVPIGAGNTTTCIDVRKGSIDPHSTCAEICQADGKPCTQAAGEINTFESNTTCSGNPSHGFACDVRVSSTFAESFDCGCE